VGGLLVRRKGGDVDGVEAAGGAEEGAERVDVEVGEAIEERGQVGDRGFAAVEQDVGGEGFAAGAEQGLKGDGGGGVDVERMRGGAWTGQDGEVVVEGGAEGAVTAVVRFGGEVVGGVEAVDPGEVVPGA
jgi:hypothetical protein